MLSYIIQLMKQLKFNYFLLTVIWIIYVSQSKKLIYVQQLFRHGARYPINAMKNDNSDFMTEERLNGELTKQGKHMHYILGKIMYDKYWRQLFNGTEYINKYHPSQMYVKSTNFNRTIESAQSHIQGLTQNLPIYQLPLSQLNYSLPPFLNSFSYQDIAQNQSSFNVYGQLNAYFHTVPIHTEKSTEVPATSNYKYSANPYDEGDFLNKYDFANCPNQKFWSKQNMANEQAMEIKKSSIVRQFLSTLSQAVGKTVKYQQAYNYIDDYQCEFYLGKQHLDMFNNPNNIETSEFISLTSMILTFFSSQDQIQSSNVRLLQNTVYRMKQAILNKGPKLVLFSAHDTTIMSFNTALNFVSVACLIDHYLNGIQNRDRCIYDYPDFATNIILELWEEDNLSHTIKILYNGVEKQIPICDYKYSCTFAQFQNWVNLNFDDNPNDLCGIRQQYTKLYIVIGVLSLFILIFVILQMRSKFKKKIQQKIQEIQEKKGYIQNFEQKQDPQFKFKEVNHEK